MQAAASPKAETPAALIVVRGKTQATLIEAENSKQTTMSVKADEA